MTVFHGRQPTPTRCVSEGRRLPSLTRRVGKRYITLVCAALFVLPGCGGGAPATLRTNVADQPLSDFTLTDHNGQPFRPARLEDKVWVAHFFFTTCAGGCVQTTETMKHLQNTYRGRGDFALVSISVNPRHDSPELLHSFAADLKAEKDQWHFLSGPQQEVHDVVQKVFFQTALPAKDPKPGYEIDHSFYLVVIDRKGVMRGYLDGRDAASSRHFKTRIDELLAEKTDAAPADDTARRVFPSVNAGLNGLCGVLLLLGYWAVRARKLTLHKAIMLSALGVSALFLASYLYYHFVVVRGVATRFPGDGLVRAAYLAILLSHTILAVIVAPLAVTVAYLGLANRLPRHVTLARWLLPIWLYVSVTGVVVYWMLYHLYPP